MQMQFSLCHVFKLYVCTLNSMFHYRMHVFYSSTQKKSLRSRKQKCFHAYNWSFLDHEQNTLTKINIAFRLNYWFEDLFKFDEKSGRHIRELWTIEEPAVKMHKHYAKTSLICELFLCQMLLNRLSLRIVSDYRNQSQAINYFSKDGFFENSPQLSSSEIATDIWQGNN